MPPVPPWFLRLCGVVDDGNEWLEQFVNELIASVCCWNDSAKVTNLVTRLRGEAYSFYEICPPNEHSSTLSCLRPL